MASVELLQGWVETSLGIEPTVGAYKFSFSQFIQFFSLVMHQNGGKKKKT
jgi:hypothetical protein